MNTESDLEVAIESLRVLGNSCEEQPAREVAANYLKRHLQFALDRDFPDEAAPDGESIPPEPEKKPDSGAMTSRAMH